MIDYRKPETSPSLIVSSINGDGLDILYDLVALLTSRLGEYRLLLVKVIWEA